jgi:DNA gyrase subunit A
MKLDEGDKLINVAMCDDNNDVMLAAKSGKCNRFAVADCRVFVGRNSSGVRGIKLADNDEVISMSILKHIKVPTEEREEYLRLSSALKKAEIAEGAEEQAFNDLQPQISYEQFKEMRENEEFILTVTVTGYGKRSSAYEYRITARGGQGVANMEMSDRNKEVVSSFPVKHDSQIMMVTDGGKLIRMPVEDIRIAGRKTQGVILFRTAENEKVVSVTWLDADDDDDDSDIAEDTVNEFDGVEAEDVAGE